MNETSSALFLRNKLGVLPAYLSAQIIGQDHILPRVSSVLKRGELGLTKPHRPRGSFLFLGPTGVGKTETALAFSNYLFGPDHVHRFDMSEYQTQDSLIRLLGENSRDEGIIGRALKQTQKGTLLFDEIEKAHPRILDVFLQILDAARVTLATGEILDFSNYYVVLTSNIGSAETMDLEHSSFSTMERHVLSNARQNLRPEIFARVTERLVFKKLSYEIQLQIAELFLSKELEFLADLGCQLTLHPSVLPVVVRVGFDSKLGARPLRDAVERLVGDAVAQTLLEGRRVQGELTESNDQEGIAIKKQGAVCG
jgi:ATP-dependent Clp protease ATP-binding subunit ClpB